MKTDRPWPWVEITPKGERALRGGHPWVYEGEIVKTENCQDGELCDVYSNKRRYLGTGFYNSASLLRVRVISRNANDLFDEAFWARRVRYALDYRQKVMGEDFSSCRLIFGEGDQFPGLTVDKFEDMLVAEVQSLGMDNLRPLIFPLLVDTLGKMGHPVRGLYERSEGGLRIKEGMAQRSGFYMMEGLTDQDPSVTITENGVKYHVDVAAGQKTGFFLDQKYNRRAVAALAKGCKVLDCFTHTGSFALNCALQGAASVHCVDASQEALDMAEKNARLNQVEGLLTFEKADALKWLPQQVEARQKYDLVILDPPAFAKQRRDAANAQRGYRDINMRGMQLVNRGGFLATATCSHHMPRAFFERALLDAALEANVQLKLVEARRQSPDHPVLLGVPETEYLKFYLFQVV